jgi:hypothetical protein
LSNPQLRKCSRVLRQSQKTLEFETSSVAQQQTRICLGRPASDLAVLVVEKLNPLRTW